MWPGAKMHPSDPAIVQAAAIEAESAAKAAAELAAKQPPKTAGDAKKKPPRKPLSQFKFEAGSAPWAASR